MNKKMPADTLESESALKVLDSLLKDSGPKKISENQIVIILDALASSDDTEVVARFPAVLAICARRGLALNSQALFSRYWETSPKRQNLEKLLLISAAIFDLQGLKAPKNLDKIVASLKPRYRDLLPGGEYQLSSGMYISLEDLQNTLKVYTSSQLKLPEVKVQKSRLKSDSLDVYLDRLFSPKQKELVLNKRDGRVFTKTEREYYSRIVRKKLEAIASEKIVELARNLVEK
ncbi:MAG: hypothetical protein KJN80_03310 [Deltaproteobacteria bacterium]|nr:hypothetical protein [Deltaproteobacteria bacterium]